jgi:hypothetical protein
MAKVIKKPAKKAQDGKVVQTWTNPRVKDGSIGKIIVADTTGYASGAKKFPSKTTDTKGTYSGTASRKQVDKMIKNPKMSSYTQRVKIGESVKKPEMKKGGKLKSKTSKK